MLRSHMADRATGGQLDGGHIAYALLGQRRARLAGVVTVGFMIVLGMPVWPGLLTWALLIALLAGFLTGPHWTT
jgi:membrane-associated protease RseP (regulator of RpoE activity)